MYVYKNKITVIIPTLNRCKLLKRTLESIKIQTFKKSDFEVLVIDNGSTDKTKMICMEYKKNNGNLRYIYDDRIGLHIGRNRGFQESTSDILVYADDDIIANPLWLETIYEGFKDKQIVLIGGNNYPLYEKNPPEWLDDLWVKDKKNKAMILHSYSVIEIGNCPRRIDPRMVYGCNFAIRKNILEKTNGFHPDGVPDKYLKYRGDGESYVCEYILKHNLKTMFYPDASVYHIITPEKMTVEYVRKIAYRTGISAGFTKIKKMHNHNIKDILKEALENFNEFKIIKDKNIIKLTKYYFAKGYLYIVFQYALNKNVRKWIKKSNYMNAVIIK